MLLCFDIGNTNIVVGCFDGEQLVAEVRLMTVRERTVDEYAAHLLSILERRIGTSIPVDTCIISSVVPPLTPIIAGVVRQHFKIEALIVGPGIRSGLSIKVSDPLSVGADRIVNAVAVRELYGTPALVVDFGTATSFDYVNAQGVYEGGAIAPGIGIALDSLVRNTAKLPRIEVAWPDSVLGKNTISAMQSGTVVGYLELVDGLIERFERELGVIPHIVATGGLGELFTKHSRKIKNYDPHLTLRGLRIIARLNQAER